VATPAKALLDLVHLVPGGDARPFLEELRLANLDQVDLASLPQRVTARPKFQRALRRLHAIAAARVSSAGAARR
jgi:hypothetical protein